MEEQRHQEYLEKEEKENRKIAGYYTVATNTVIFLILILVKFSEFQPPAPLSGGIELNFGTDAKGSGDIRTRNKASDLKNKVESKPAPEKVEEKAKPVKKVEAKKPEPKPEKITKKPAKTPETPVVSSKVKSPVQVEDKPFKKPTVTPAKPSPPAEKPTPQPEAKKPVVEPTPEPPKPQVNEGGLFKKGGKSTSNGTSGTSDAPGGNNNGDGKNKEVGDQGDPKGKLDAKGLYGKGGTGGGKDGAAISITGWTWRSKPNVNDDSDETGKIVFQIKVDDQGSIISVKVVESSVSPSILDKYKRAVQALDLRQTSDGDPPATSTGTITFILRAK